MTSAHYTEEQKNFLFEALICNKANRDIVKQFINKFGRNITTSGVSAFKRRNNLNGDHFYSKKMLNFINKKLIDGVSGPKIVQEFNDKFNQNRTLGAIQAIIFKKKLQPNPKKITKLSSEQIAFLKNNVKGNFFKDLTEQFNQFFGTNYSINQIACHCHERSFCNGMTGKHEQISTKPKGSDTVWGKKIKTRYTKTDDNKWELKQRVVYEKHFGKIPDGCNIVFIDHNPENFDPENLALVTKQQMTMLMKTKFSYSDKQTFQNQIALADLRLAIGEAERKLKNKNKKRGK